VEAGPNGKFDLSIEQAYTELARRYFRWIGPATLSEFQWFSRLGVKAAKSAVEPLKLVPVEHSSERLMFPEDRDLLANFKIPAKPQYALVSAMDSMFLLRRDLRLLLTPAASKQRVGSGKGICELGSLADLTSNAFLDRGAIVGLWEYDPETASIAWLSFAKPDKAMPDCVSRTEAFIRDQLGDARSFSLDSPKSRAPRIAAIRKAQKDS
jgi:hypothetical protein